MSRTALTREVPQSIARCELTHLERVPIDYARAAAQHEEYEAALVALGCAIERIPPTPELADSVFVEDAAVVFEDVAIVTRPGAPSRRAEIATVAGVLSRYRPLRFIEASGTVDGGDVLRAGRRVFVGLSSRTNAEGAAQLRDLLLPFDYSVETVEVRGCLHLKSAATSLARDLLLVNPDWVDVEQFGGLRLVDVHPEEPFAANVLAIDNVVLCPAAAPRTAQTLETNGFSTIPVDMSELAKAEAGLTCCSLIIEGSI